MCNHFLADEAACQKKKCKQWQPLCLSDQSDPIQENLESNLKIGQLKQTSPFSSKYYLV